MPRVTHSTTDQPSRCKSVESRTKLAVINLPVWKNLSRSSESTLGSLPWGAFSMTVGSKQSTECVIWSQIWLSAQNKEPSKVEIRLCQGWGVSFRVSSSEWPFWKTDTESEMCYNPQETLCGQRANAKGLWLVEITAENWVWWCVVHTSSASAPEAEDVESFEFQDS